MKSPIVRLWIVLLITCFGGPNARAQSGDVTEDGSDSFFNEPESGFRFGADALMWRRNNDASGPPVVGGPEGVSMGGQNYDAVGGYRLTAGWMIDSNYEVEGVWTQFADWTSSQSGVFTRSISFDGGQASPFVDPTGDANFINTTTLFRPMFDAATDPLGGALDPDNETTEFEFLRPGAMYKLRQTSQISDGQLNFKSRRTQGTRFGFGLGYRYFSLDESALAKVIGNLDAVDLDGDEVILNDPNDQLSDAALQANGLVRVSGGNFNDQAGGASTLTLLSGSSAQNKLNGLQGIFDATLFEQGRVRLDGLARTGLFLNQITGSIGERYSDTNNSVYTRTFTDEKDKLAFAANLGLDLSIRLAERVKFRTGYECMFVNNVALGASQQSGIKYNALGQASYSVQADDSIFLYGGRVGLEVDW